MKRQKKVGFYTRTREPANTYTSFWDAPVAQIKQGRNKDQVIPVERPLIMQEMPDETREPEIYTYWDTMPSRTKRVKVKIRVPGKRPGTTKWGSVNGIRVKTPNPEGNPVKKFEVPKHSRDEKSPEFTRYQKHTNFDFTKKKYYGRFTKNPKAPGKTIAQIYNREYPIHHAEHNKEELINHVRNLLLKGGK
jgi:hypothetical protein